MHKKGSYFSPLYVCGIGNGGNDVGAAMSFFSSGQKLVQNTDLIPIYSDKADHKHIEGVYFNKMNQRCKGTFRSWGNTDTIKNCTDLKLGIE